MNAIDLIIEASRKKEDWKKWNLLHKKSKKKSIKSWISFLTKHSKIF